MRIENGRKIYDNVEEFKNDYGFYPDDMPDEMNAEDNAVTTSKDLVITFIKSDGTAYNLTIPDYKNDITDEAVAEGANAILAENVFAPGGLSLIKADHAKRVDKTTTDIDFGE